MKKYIALGDSYTVCETAHREFEWTHRFAFDCKLELVKVIAASGWTSENLLDKCNKYLKHYNFEIATVFIGVNDWYDGIEIDKFRNNLKQIIYLLQDKGSAIFLMTIPNYLVSKEGIKNSIDKLDETESKRWKDKLTIHDFNEAIKSISKQFNVHVVDLENVLKETDFKDGLHPNKDGIDIWLNNINRSFQNNAK